MNVTIISEKQFKDFINKILQECIQEITKQAAEYLKDFVNREWYQSNSPAMYQRTYEFLNSIVSSQVKKKSNGFEAKVYFDTSLITPNFLGGDLWNQHMSFDGSPFTNGLVEVIENGNPSPYYNPDGIHMFSETAKWLENELPKIAKSVFAKYGILIYLI